MSSKISNMEDLRDAIRDLEHQNYVNEQQMRRRVSQVAESLKPINLLRNTISHVFNGTERKGNLLRMVAGIATSFIVKKFFKKKIAAK